MGTNTTNAANGALFKKLSYDTDKDFAPIMRCVTGVNALVVNNDAAGQDDRRAGRLRQEESRQAELRRGQRLAAPVGRDVQPLAGVKIERVPYKASPQALGDVASGQVQVMFPDLPQALTQIEAGRVRGLGDHRPASAPRVAPDLPAIAEAVPGYSLVYWLAVFAPAATPKADPEEAVRRHRRGAEGPGHGQGDDPGPHGESPPLGLDEFAAYVKSRDQLVDQGDQGGRHRAGVSDAMSKVIIEKNGPVKTIWMNRPEKTQRARQRAAAAT